MKVQLIKTIRTIENNTSLFIAKYHDKVFKKRGKIFKSIGNLKGKFDKKSFDFVKSDELIANVHGMKIIVDKDDNDMSEKYLLDGFREEKLAMEIFSSNLKKDMVVVDIGAHYGVYSILSSPLVKEVYAFEPYEKNFNILKRNIELNKCKNIIAVNKAISDKKGKLKFYYEDNFSGSPNFIKESVMGVSNHAENKLKCCYVDAIRFKDYFKDKKINAIKIDLGGGEARFFYDNLDLFKYGNVKIIIMEFNPDFIRADGFDPIEFLIDLSGFGYDIKKINYKDSILEEINFEDDKLKKGEGFNLVLKK